ncbi:MAG: TAT-variant-translocated molybdopterin oxidoreductase [Myxococcales bacterium]|nr:TAT-variant-translocated molybdopterin oxidoreductase [Myxococcales bacterium]
MSSLKLTKSGRVVPLGHGASESSKGTAPKSASLGPSQDGFWRSQADLDNTPEFQEFLAREYPEQEEQLKDPLSRRRFVQLMGASFALAGVSQAGCRWEEDKILPLSRRPDGYIPGVAKQYASAFELGGSAAGLLVTCMDGRPIKIEGNPEHPFTGGASTSVAQASILEMYDPDRSRAVRRQENGQGLIATRADALEALRKLRDDAKGTRGAGLHVLSEATSSPTVAKLRQEIQAAMPGVKWHEYEPLSTDEQREGNRMAFGTPHRTHYLLDRAAVIATFDAELFGNHPAALRHSTHFAAGRNPDTGKQNRLYAVESAYSLTGAVADHRLPVRSELIKPILLGLEQVLAKGDIASVGAAILGEAKVGKFITELAKDLQKNAGKGIVAVGDQQPAEVHAIAARINESLRNQNSTVAYTVEDNPQRPRHTDDLKGLVASMQSGKVSGLLIIGGNPVYNAPTDLDFAGALAKVDSSVHLSMYDDETSKLTNWHINRAHYLEAWGDSRSYDHTVTLAQPMIEPLYDGLSPLDVLKVLAGRDDDTNQDLVRGTLLAMAGSDASNNKVWRRLLHDGFLPGSGSRPASVVPKQFAATPLTEGQKLGNSIPNGKLEVTFRESATYDGRYANNSWLVETPDFMTKLTWDNAALIGPATAKSLGVSNGELAKIQVGDATLKMVVHVSPGQAPGSVALPLGWGRNRAGHVGGHEDYKVKAPGFNTYALRTSAGFSSVNGVTVKGTGESYPLAETQDHFAMEEFFDIGTKATNEAVQTRANVQIKTATLETYKKDKEKIITKDAHIEIEKKLLRPIEGREINASLYDEHEYKGHKWGMSIDLGKCTGCNSCSVACQAENNIPVVGKTEVMNNREMHWIRIDRFFKGNPNNPEMAFLPVYCQQCEGAPCEVVCPVEATSHSDEGLNDMTYNRCVGTRYCAANCPYKVRRFNFKYWNKDFEVARNKVRTLLSNPDVTVRSRGVMEKCTWCVQRIERTKIDAKNNRRSIVDGEIKTACQQACPTQAIRFGDLADKESVVYKNQELPRAYALLASLNNSPRNAFLARITNPNPALAPAKEHKDH